MDRCGKVVDLGQVKRNERPFVLRSSLEISEIIYVSRRPMCMRRNLPLQVTGARCLFMRRLKLHFFAWVLGHKRV